MGVSYETNCPTTKKGGDMKRRLCLALIIVMIAGFATTMFGNNADKPVILDVRTVREWNNGHLDGAVLIPYDQISEKIGAVVKEKSQRIYVYCRTGRRSQIAKEAGVADGTVLPATPPR